MFWLTAILRDKDVVIGSEVNKTLLNSVPCFSVLLLCWCSQTRSAIKLQTFGFGFYWSLFQNLYSHCSFSSVLSFTGHSSKICKATLVSLASFLLLVTLPKFV
jgi:hypothetical protein